MESSSTIYKKSRLDKKDWKIWNNLKFKDKGDSQRDERYSNRDIDMFGHSACHHTGWNNIGTLTVGLHNLFLVWWNFLWIILVCNDGYVPRHFGGVKEQRRRARAFEVERHVTLFVLSFDCAYSLRASDALVCFSLTCNYCGKATSNKWVFSFDRKGDEICGHSDVFWG